MKTKSLLFILLFCLLWINLYGQASPVATISLTETATHPGSFNGINYQLPDGQSGHIGRRQSIASAVYDDKLTFTAADGQSSAEFGVYFGTDRSGNFVPGSNPVKIEEEHGCMAVFLEKGTFDKLSSLAVSFWLLGINVEMEEEEITGMVQGSETSILNGSIGTRVSNSENDIVYISYSTNGKITEDNYYRYQLRFENLNPEDYITLEKVVFYKDDSSLTELPDPLSGIIKYEFDGASVEGWEDWQSGASLSVLNGFCRVVKAENRDGVKLTVRNIAKINTALYPIIAFKLKSADGTDVRNAYFQINHPDSKIGSFTTSGTELERKGDVYYVDLSTLISDKQASMPNSEFTASYLFVGFNFYENVLNDIPAYIDWIRTYPTIEEIPDEVLTPDPYVVNRETLISEKYLSDATAVELTGDWYTESLNNLVIAFESNESQPEITAENVMLTEGESLQFTLPFNAMSISYERTLADVALQTICLPFEVVDLPCQVEEYKEHLNTKLIFEEADKMEAGMPYIISGTANSKVLFTAENVLVNADPVEVIPAGSDYKFTGTFLACEKGNTTGKYISDGTSFRIAGENAEIAPYRAYFEAINEEGKGANALGVGVDGETTSLETFSATNNLIINSEHGVLEITSSQEELVRIYTVEGNMIYSEIVQPGITTINGLPEGVYLINTQKFIIR